MAAPKIDPNVLAHREWIGFVQPTGLVVSAPALVRAGAILDRNDAEGQRLLRASVEKRVLAAGQEPVPVLPDFELFARKVLGWSFSPKGYAGTAESPIPPELEVALPDYEGVLRPDFAVRELDPKEGAPPWQLLVQVLPLGEDLEESAHGRLERLLRTVRVPAGLLFNGRTLRLLSAPSGESSGWLDFQVADMEKTDGRPICAALRLLLGEFRLLSLPRGQRFAALLEDSRRFQNEVSERLAEQVLHALYELLRGLQAAHDASHGELLRDPLAHHPDEVYRALLTVILRLVFLLYAEERDMLPKDETFQRFYSLAGLFERLREDAALFPDTMDQRYGAWAQLLVLFRMVHDGAEHGEMRLPKRHGALFDPSRFPFLEGRRSSAAVQLHERIEPPRVPDGTIYRALEKLLVLDGERISYRALDVEQIGSVYETMMGFRLETASGPSIAVKAQKKQGAPTAVDLEALLAEPPAQRDKWLQERTSRKLSDKVKSEVKAAASVADLHAALRPVVDDAATPDLVQQGWMVLQPSEERRRSGSHYTPRSLTEPIVRTTLEPILTRLRGSEGHPPRPEQILDLKVCDPAMGSGAFLVEACRQLGDALVDSWRHYGEIPAIPSDEDEVIFARRLVAQRCLYGVDRNPVAVDLAKVSLWLVTLAKDHPLTFLDHALRHGDSLVGLSRKQIEAFHWDESKPPVLRGLGIRDSLDTVIDLRRRIREAGEGIQDWELRDWWTEAQAELKRVRILGDLVLAAFFEGDSSKEREAKRNLYLTETLNGTAEDHRARLEEWQEAAKPFVPFHWEIEFPEVFERENPGFDAIIGNPPFAGKNMVSQSNLAGYLVWLKDLHAARGVESSVANADLVAHFFRRAFALLRGLGAFGLVATNTVYQGDSRRAGLSWISSNGGTIYSAVRRMAWPGLAAVIVCSVHIIRTSNWLGPRRLGGVRVAYLSPLLLAVPMDGEPRSLLDNIGRAFKGCEIGSLGFLFAWEQVASLAALMRSDGTPLVKEYIGGEDLGSESEPASGRFAIDSDGMGRAQLPFQAMALLRPTLLEDLSRRGLASDEDEWWHFRRPSTETRRLLISGTGALAISHVSTVFGITYLGPAFLPNHTVILFDVPRGPGICALQSRCHEVWARALSGTMKDDLRYAPTDCFETFPFPDKWEELHTLGAAGSSYYEFRAALMIRNNQGLTKLYHRFHDPYEQSPDILKLRELHAAMDRAVLDAYDWHDIPTICEFLLDYEIDEEETGRKKKPWRYRWPDDVHDEVLARLLKLNAKRAKEEQLSGASAAKKGKGRKGKSKQASDTTTPGDLFS